MRGVSNRAALFLLMAVAIQTIVAAQTILPDPARARGISTQVAISTSSSAPSAAAGEKVSLYVDVEPRSGIHVYAPGTKDYLPIAVTPTLVPGLSFAPTKYPAHEMLKFAGDRVPVYQKPFRLVKEVTIRPGAKPGTAFLVDAVVDYQACDDKVCFKPATVPVSWTISVR